MWPFCATRDVRNFSNLTFWTTWLQESNRARWKIPQIYMRFPAINLHSIYHDIPIESHIITYRCRYMYIYKYIYNYIYRERDDIHWYSIYKEDFPAHVWLPEGSRIDHHAPQLAPAPPLHHSEARWVCTPQGQTCAWSNLAAMGNRMVLRLHLLALTPRRGTTQKRSLPLTLKGGIEDWESLP